jgi:hypothetical protein
MPDKAALPTAPSKPRTELLKNGAIELEWNAPDHIGESPITHYTVKYWSAISDNPTVGYFWVFIVLSMEFFMKILRNFCLFLF